MARELTEKQKQFCKNVVSGMTYKDSYITAYETSCSEQVAYNESSKLMLRDDIQAEIKRISRPLEKAYQSNILSEREKKKAIIWERIQACIDNNDDTSVARYMDILNKMDSEYININRNITDNNDNVVDLDTDKLLKLVTTA